MTEEGGARYATEPGNPMRSMIIYKLISRCEAILAAFAPRTTSTLLRPSATPPRASTNSAGGILYGLRTVNFRPEISWTIFNNLGVST